MASASISCDVHPNLVAHPPYTAFEDIADAEFVSDLLHADCLAFVYETGIPSDHEKPTDTRECGDDLLNHTLRKILLLRIATHVLKRQDGDGRFIGERQCRGGFANAFRNRYLIHPHRLGDVLEPLIAQIICCKFYLPLNLSIGVT